MPSPAFTFQKRTAIPARMPAPVRGLNTVDSFALMDPQYGLSIQNFICTPQGLSVRQAYKRWTTNLPGPTTSLLTYHGKTSTSSKLFAVSSGEFYDVTNPGDAGSPVITGLTPEAGYWQSAVQSNSTAPNSFMFAVNGVDMPQMYDGTNWIACSQVSTPAGPGQFKTTDNNGTAVNIANFVDVLLHQQRLWFVAGNSTKAYYLDIASVGGNLTAFDFGPFFPSGGNLQKLATWTGDMSGSLGSQAVLVAMSDRGDVVIYAGGNPQDSNDWKMSGQLKIGAPIGRRCTTQYQGDLLLLTQDGLVPMSRYIASGRTDSSAAVTYKIGPTISNIVSQYGDKPGFECVVYPGNDVMLMNVPQSSQVNNFQFCMHTQTMGWTQFTGWPAQCFGQFKDALYFGGPDFIGICFTGYKDDAELDGSGGNNVIATAMSAFNSLDDQIGAPGLIKQVTQIKPYIISGILNPKISVGVNADFNLIPITGSATVAPNTGGIWDLSTWDHPDATWVGTLIPYNRWSRVTCYPGSYFAVVLSVSAVEDTLWSATDLMIRVGGPYG